VIDLLAQDRDVVFSSLPFPRTLSICSREGLPKIKTKNDFWTSEAPGIESHLSHRCETQRQPAGSIGVLPDERDVEPLRRLFRGIVEEESSYPHERHDRPLDCGLFWRAIADRMVDKHSVSQ
jgi:hypothetical protein